MARTLKEILLEKETKITKLGKDGTYIAVRFNTATQNKLRKLTKELGISNEKMVPREKLHCTVVYSRKPFKDFTIKGKMKEPIVAEPDKLEIFKTQSGASALVLRFHSKELDERHNYFKEEHGATYDYDEYKQHVTLSYDVGEDWKIPKDFDIKKIVDSIEIDEEYYEELNLDWAKSEGTESEAVVICGFPGVGKSRLVKAVGKDKILDSDSSTFDKKDFPSNYIKHIKETLESGKSILASSHKEVRDALIKEEIPFVLVYPHIFLKDEYMERYKKRGNVQSFLDLLDKNFIKWVDECSDIDSPLVTKISLKKGEFLVNNKKVRELLQLDSLTESLLEMTMKSAPMGKENEAAMTSHLEFMDENSSVTGYVDMKPVLEMRKNGEVNISIRNDDKSTSMVSGELMEFDGRECFLLYVMYTLPEYRNKGDITRLLWFIKHNLGLNIIFYGIQSPDAINTLNQLSKNPRMSLKWVNLETKETDDYVNDKRTAYVNSDWKVLIENDSHWGESNLLERWGDTVLSGGIHYSMVMGPDDYNEYI